jgi:hypothetical protein
VFHASRLIRSLFVTRLPISSIALVFETGIDVFRMNTDARYPHHEMLRVIRATAGMTRSPWRPFAISTYEHVQ